LPVNTYDVVVHSAVFVPLRSCPHLCAWANDADFCAPIMKRSIFGVVDRCKEKQGSFHLLWKRDFHTSGGCRGRGILWSSSYQDGSRKGEDEKWGKMARSFVSLLLYLFSCAISFHFSRSYPLYPAALVCVYL